MGPGHDSYGYDAGGNVTSVTDPLGHVTTYAYDGDNNVISMTDPWAAIDDLSPTTSTARSPSVTDPNGNTTDVPVQQPGPS